MLIMSSIGAGSQGPGGSPSFFICGRGEGGGASLVSKNFPLLEKGNLLKVLIIYLAYVEKSSPPLVPPQSKCTLHACAVVMCRQANCSSLCSIKGEHVRSRNHLQLNSSVHI